MSEQRRTTPNHVSYIERSGDFYAAQGYERRYQWAANDGAPFAPLPGPLAELRVGLVTTAYLGPEEPFVADRSRIGELLTERLSWAKDETHTDDPNSYLPFERLDELVTEGRLGSVSPRFYGVPTIYSHRRTEQRDAPRIAAWVAEDDVDLALLVPL